MDFIASILPFIAASICLVFSLYFLIIALIIREERAFLGLSLMMLILAANQFAVGMQVHLLPVNTDQLFFWYRVKFAALALVVFMTIHLFYTLSAGKVNKTILYVFFFICACLAVSTFSPLFGTFTATEEVSFVLLPRVGALSIALLLAAAIVFLMFLSVYPLVTCRRKPKTGVLFCYIVGGILLLGFGALEIMTELRVIDPFSIKPSSIGAVIFTLVGASAALVRSYDTRSSLRNTLINLTETEREHKHTELMAITDGLTGLYNRGFFDESLEEEVTDSIRNNKSLSLIMMDIDCFKSVNDTLGRAIGDSALAEISAVIKRNARGSDFPARYGGEEFAVILPNTNVHEAHEMGERIRKTIQKISFVVKGKPETSVTISAGVTTLKGSDLAVDFLARAGKALAAAKKRGKNNTFVID